MRSMNIPKTEPSQVTAWFFSVLALGLVSVSARSAETSEVPPVATSAPVPPVVSVFSEEDRHHFVAATSAIRRGDLNVAKLTLLGLQARLPRRPEILNNLAVLESLLGDEATALKIFLAAARLEPTYLSIHENAERSRAASSGVRTGTYILIEALPGPSQFAGDLKSATQRPRTSDVPQALPSPAPSIALPSLSEPTALSPELARPEPGELLEAVEQWRRAWEAQDIAAYLNWYDGDFQPGTSLSRQAWEKHRRGVFAKASEVTLKVSDIQTSVSSSTADSPSAEARVEFFQTYRARHHSDQGRKVMRWRWKDGQWRILSEAFKAD